MIALESLRGPALLAAALLLSTAAMADELSCDFQHQCYHMDPAHPDKVTPPPAPQYPSLATAPTPRAPSLPDDDPHSCFNLRRGLFATPQAAANARSRCN